EGLRVSRTPILEEDLDAVFRGNGVHGVAPCERANEGGITSANEGGGLEQDKPGRSVHTRSMCGAGHRSVSVSPANTERGSPGSSSAASAGASARTPWVAT